MQNVTGYNAAPDKGKIKRSNAEVREKPNYDRNEKEKPAAVIKIVSLWLIKIDETFCGRVKPSQYDNVVRTQRTKATAGNSQQTATYIYIYIYELYPWEYVY